MCGTPMALVWGGDESADVAGRQVGEGFERWKGAGRLWRAPLNNGGAPSFCGRFGDFLLFFMQLRVDDF